MGDIFLARPTSNCPNFEIRHIKGEGAKAQVIAHLINLFRQLG